MVLSITHVENVAEKQKVDNLSAEASRLSAEVDSLNKQIALQTSYVHSLAAALVLTTALALPVLAFVAWERCVKPKQLRGMGK